MFWIALLPNPPKAEALSPPHEPAGPPFVLPPGLSLETLAWQALRFGPRVALLEEAVLLEAQNSLRLWGGKRRLLQELEQMGSEPSSNAPTAPAHTGLAHANLILVSAPTALAALALARHANDLPDHHTGAQAARGHNTRHHLGPAQLSTGLDALPLHTLSAAALHAPTLARLGCRSLGQVRALPRGGLQRRFGAALLDALDQAYGSKPESHVWITLPETFAQRVELPMHTESADALLFAARRMLQALQAWLAARQSGIRSFELQWLYEYRHRDEAAGGALTIATAQTSRDLTHWLRLLAEHLARQSLAAPVCELRLQVTQTEPLAPDNSSLLSDPGQEQSDLLQFLERVGARLGAGKVLSAQARSDHRVERQALWQSAVQMHAAGSKPSHRRRPLSSAVLAQAQPLDCGLRRNDEPSRFGARQDRQGEGHSPLPCWLLGQALALPVDAQDRPLYQGALKLLAGPERIEAGWWDCDAPAPEDRQREGRRGAEHPREGSRAPEHPREGHRSPSNNLALRDYFLAQSEHAGLLWIYRERQPAPSAAQWFLHGIHG